MDKISKTIIISFITNISLSIMQIITGIIGASGAIIADGLHSLSDTSTDIFAYIGHKISKKPADYNHPLGHGKAEYITCAFISIVILGMGFMVIYNGLFSARTIPSIYVAIVTVFTIIVKYILSSYLINRGKKYNSKILVSSGSESFSDVLSSVVVLISVILSQFSQYFYIFTYADMLAMFIVALFILRIGFKLLVENISNLLDSRVTDEKYLNKIKEIIKKYDDVKRIDNLIVFKEGPFYKIDIEISMDKNMKLSNVDLTMQKIEKDIQTFDKDIIYIIIHPNPWNES